jgi:hypothetical protein
MVELDRAWVVVKFTDGRYKIWADYGDDVWGSPAYEVLDYFSDYRVAQKAVRQDRKGNYVQLDSRIA